MTGPEMSIEEWVSLVFDRRVTKPQWYFDMDVDDTAIMAVEKWTPEQATTLLTRLFENSSTLLNPYSDAQANQ